jgi:hypothetical protein
MTTPTARPSALGVNLGVDAVEQFTVLTSNYPAQVGRSSGGVVAASTRTGTNSFHGDAFEFIRNSALDARNFFDKAKPPFRRNQFGASAGGPLRKDRTFLFGDYEGLRASTGITLVDSSPSPAARSGTLCDRTVTDCIRTITISVDPTVLKFVNAFWPAPNGPLQCPFPDKPCLPGTGDTGVFTFAGQEITPENYFTTKMDHKLSTEDTLSGTYMFDGGTVRQPDELDNKRTGFDSRRQFFTVSEAHTFSPEILNSIRLGIYRVVATTGLTLASGNQSAGDPSFGTVPDTMPQGLLCRVSRSSLVAWVRPRNSIFIGHRFRLTTMPQGRGQIMRSNSALGSNEFGTIIWAFRRQEGNFFSIQFPIF